MEKDRTGVFRLTPQAQLRSFLILGVEGRTMYATQRELIIRNISCLDALLTSGRGIDVVNIIVDVSTQARAPKNDPAIFALAYAARYGDEATRRAAYDAMPKVCRTGTHLFQWCAAMKEMGSTLGSSGARRAIQAWYAKPPEKLALQYIKYAQRGGWSHRDVMLLGHVKPPQDDRVMRDVMQYGSRPNSIKFAEDAAVPLLYAAQRAKEGDLSTDAMVKLITDYRLPREAVPTKFLADREIWEALLQSMPMTAMVRNLGKMTSVGLLEPLSDASKLVRDRLADQDRITRSRMHPFQVLAAETTYRSGSGVRGSLTWKPVDMVVDALDDAFYAAFGNIKPSGKNMLLALDVSGSMDWSTIAGLPNMTPRLATAAMALITVRTEPNAIIRAFTHSFQDPKITAKDTLQSALYKVLHLHFGATDCSLPMEWAREQKVPVDGFVIYTDSENNCSRRPPYVALREYREEMSRDARLAVVGMTASGASIADPTVATMLDVVGFDTATPNIISDFVAGEF